ncbi:hypothetical protein FS837_011569 [Tulasnella sp. UAMH 9824]|nr:hypothetical protein FS837_011569 [Tulasnella sp. UAMH 9824]
MRVIAAQQLRQARIDNFLIVEARDELGGRVYSGKLDKYTLDLGCNRVQGPQTGMTKVPGFWPIYNLAVKHGIAIPRAIGKISSSTMRTDTLVATSKRRIGSFVKAYKTLLTRAGMLDRGMYRLDGRSADRSATMSPSQANTSTRAKST